MGRRTDPVIVEVVKRLYGKYPARILAMACNCGVQCIYQLAFKMGIKCGNVSKPRCEQINTALLKIVEQEVQKIKQELTLNANMQSK